MRQEQTYTRMAEGVTCSIFCDGAMTTQLTTRIAELEGKLMQQT